MAQWVSWLWVSRGITLSSEFWKRKMKQLRWAMDGDFWELDISTPTTLEGTARPVPGDSLPLGLSRGARLSRPNQIDFFHRFMATPLLPSYSSLRGFSLQRVFTIPFSNTWSLFHFFFFSLPISFQGCPILILAYAGMLPCWVSSIAESSCLLWRRVGLRPSRPPPGCTTLPDIFVKNLCTRLVCALSSY